MNRGHTDQDSEVDNAFHDTTLAYLSFRVRLNASEGSESKNKLNTSEF